MSEDDKMICYKAIDLMWSHGAITKWTADSLRIAVEQNNERTDGRNV